MKIKYIHNLNYSYEEPVHLGEHRICIKPRSQGFQKLINFELKIDPKPVYFYPLLTASGEEIHKASFDKQTDKLFINAVSEVETSGHPNIFECVKDRDLTLPFSGKLTDKDLKGSLEG